MNLSNIILNTSDKSELSRYISELFDIEVENTNDEYFVEIGGLKFIFRDEFTEENNSECTVLDFQLDSLDELSDLLKKIQFLNYRLNANDSDQDQYQIPEIQGDNSIQYFEIRDPDNRKWRFYTKE